MQPRWPGSVYFWVRAFPFASCLLPSSPGGMGRRRRARDQGLSSLGTMLLMVSSPCWGTLDTDIAFCSLRTPQAPAISPFLNPVSVAPPPSIRPSCGRSPARPAGLSQAHAAAADAGKMDAGGGVQRHFVILCHNITQAMLQGEFNINNLLEGRVDVWCRCVSTALWLSNDLRRNTHVWLLLGQSGLSVEISGRDVIGLNPDEKTTALFLQRALAAHAGLPALTKSLVQRQQFLRQGQPPPLARGQLAKSPRNQERKTRERLARTVEAAAVHAPSGFVVHTNDSVHQRLTTLRSEIGTGMREEGVGEGAVVGLMLHESGQPCTQQLLRDFACEGQRPGLRRVEIIVLGDKAGYCT